MGFTRLYEVGITGKGVKVGVMDSGVYTEHPWLKDRVAVARSAFDYEDEQDYFGHGTHVSGIIAKLAPDVSLYSYKILDSDGRGDLFTLIRGFDWAVNDGVDVINLSLGSPVNCCFSTIRLIHESAKDMGVFPIYAVGNFGEGKVACPAMIEDTLAVGSVDVDGSVADFTSRGPGCFFYRRPDTYAFGGGSKSCVISAWTPLSRRRPGMYACVRGTSQAAPQVTAATALFIQAYREKYGVGPRYEDVKRVVELATENNILRVDEMNRAVVNPVAQLLLSLALLLVGEAVWRLRTR